jgi:phosphohistidine phosphatase
MAAAASATLPQREQPRETAMKLVLVRHAPAVPRRRGVPDAGRPLTTSGRTRFRRAVAGMRRLGLLLDRVYHSPRRRAVETADLLAPLLRGESVATASLAHLPSTALLSEIRGTRVALVGHDPSLAMLASWLVTGDRRHAARFAMKKGGVIVLEGALRPGAMRLVASLPPKALRRMARS